MAGKNLKIKLSSFDSKLIRKSFDLILKSVTPIGAKIRGPVFLPTNIQKIKLLRSPHVDRASIAQYEIRTYKAFMYIDDANQSVIENLGTISINLGVRIDIKLIKNKK